MTVCFCVSCWLEKSLGLGPGLSQRWWWKILSLRSLLLRSPWILGTDLSKWVRSAIFSVQQSSQSGSRFNHTELSWPSQFLTQISRIWYIFSVSGHTSVCLCQMRRTNHLSDVICHLLARIRTRVRDVESLFWFTSSLLSHSYSKQPTFYSVKTPFYLPN